MDEKHVSLIKEKAKLLEGVLGARFATASVFLKNASKNIEGEDQDLRITQWRRAG